MSSHVSGQVPSIKKIRHGIKVFAILTVVSMAAVFFFTSSSESWELLRQINPPLLILSIFLGLLNHFWSCLQLHVLIKKLEPKFKFIHSCQATLGSLFMAAVTPTQSGGGPMQMVILKAKGLTYPQSIAAGFMQFLASVAFLFISIVFLLVTRNQALFNEKINHFINYGLVIMFLLGLLFFFAIIKPEIILWLTRGLIKIFEWIVPSRYTESLQRVTHQIYVGVEESHYAILLFFRKGKIAIISSILFASASMITKFIIAYVILIAFNYNPPFMEVMTIQIILNFLIYFAPSPGGSGIAEFGTVILMDVLVKKSFLGIFTILWRTFTMFMGVIIGGVIILRFIAKFEDHLDNLSIKRTKKHDD